MKEKWTTGPWKAVDAGDFAVICEVGSMVVVPVRGRPAGGRRQVEYDANLIAASPELYSELASSDAQLVMAAEAIEQGKYDEAILHCRSMTRPRRAVLAKARGEQE